MRKVISYLFLIIGIFLIGFNVYAKEAKPMELISVYDEATSVDTDHFYYSNITFSTDKGRFDFKSVKNKKSDESYLTVSIALFNESKKNIGLITYCSRKDLDGKQSQVKVNGNSEFPLNIDVKDRYLVGSNSFYDISYYAIIDDNNDCRSIDNNKYQGLTIEEIKDGKISSKYNDNTLWINDFFKKIDFNFFIKVLVGLIIFYLVISIIFSLLYKCINEKSSPINFIPIINIFYGYKMALGTISMIIFIILVIASIALFITKNNIIMIIIVGILFIFAIIMSFYKMITGNFRALYIEDKFKFKRKKSEVVVDSNDQGNQQLDLSFDGKTADGLEMVSDVNARIDETNSNDVVEGLPLGNTNTDVGNAALDLNFTDKDKDDDPWGFN